MSQDFIDDAFKDLDVYYPGSKRKRKETKKTAIKDEPSGWDAKPFTVTLPNGKDIELYAAGALAAALGRPFVSIRVWNKEGYLPSAPYRTADKLDKHGKLHKGRRLYSRAMIEAAVDIFKAAGLLEAKRIEWPQHRKLSQEIADTWTKILETESK